MESDPKVNHNNSHSHTFWKRHRNTLLIPIWIIALMELGTLFSAASAIFIWIITSFFLFVLLNPWVERLSRYGLNPLLGSLITLSILCSILGLGGYGLYANFEAISSELILYKDVLVDLYKDGYTSAEDMVKVVEEVGKTSVGEASEVRKVEVVEPSPLKGALGDSILRGLGSAITAIAFIFLTPVLTFFLAERIILSSALSRLFRISDSAEKIWLQVSLATNVFFLGNLILAAVSYPFFALSFWLFNIPNFLPLAAVASVVNLIPFLGAVLSGLLPMLALLAHGGSLLLALWIAFICLVIHFLVANVFTPKLIGSKVDLNAASATIALVVWGEIWGAIGLFLAIPITATLKIMFQYSGNAYLEWMALLMSEDPNSLVGRIYRRKRKVSHRSI